MTLNFGNLIVFSAGDIFLFINDLVVDDPVELIRQESLESAIPFARNSLTFDLKMENQPEKEKSWIR